MLLTLVDIAEAATAHPLMNMFALAVMAQNMSKEKTELFGQLWQRVQFYVPWLDGGGTPKDPKALWS